jgi:hypothetical protein
MVGTWNLEEEEWECTDRSDCFGHLETTDNDSQPSSAKRGYRQFIFNVTQFCRRVEYAPRIATQSGSMRTLKIDPGIRVVRPIMSN